MPVIDDFEDGDTAGWSGGNDGLTATSNGFIQGTYEARMYSSGRNSYAEIGGLGADAGRLELTFRMGSSTSSGDDHTGVEFRDSGGNSSGSIARFSDSGDILVQDGSVVGSWSPNTNYTVEMFPNYAGGTYDLNINGSTVATGVPFAGSVSDVDVIRVNNQTFFSGESRYLYWDDVRYESAPPPQMLTAEGTTETTADLSWTDADSEDGYRILFADSSGSGTSDYTQFSDLPANTTTETVTGLENGEQFYFRVETYEGGLSSLTNEVSQTTALPAPAIDDIVAPAKGELTVEYSLGDNSSDGDVLLERSADGGTTWTDAGTAGPSASSITDTGLDDGEEYTYRLTRRTEHAESTSGTASAVTVLPAPTIGNLDVSTQLEITVEYTLEDTSSDGDVLLEASTDSGSSWSDVATIGDLDATTYTHTGLDDGTEYTYRLTRRTEHAESTSDTASATTVAPEPVLDDLTVDGDILEATGTDTGVGELRHVIEVRRVDVVDDSWTQSGADIDAEPGDGNTITGTTDPLLDGERYRARLRTVYPDASATSNRIARTTALPDEDQPILGNGVEDEIQLDRESAVSDYGSVRVEYRETGAAGWIDWGVVPYDRLDPVIESLEDGEEYEIRARTETEHVTGAWTTPVAIVTKFPGATGLQITGVTETSVSGEFVDNADNEDGFELERREQFRDGYGDWQVVETLGPNSGTGTVTWTDDNALPGTTYELRIRAYTEHSEATTGAVEATTDDDGVTTDRVPAQGWHVVAEDDAGRTLSPEVADVDWSPQVNQRPRISVTVPQRDGWESLEGNPMRVYHDGYQLPIDSLDGTSDTIGTDTAETVLEGSGGQALDDYTDDIQIDQQENHLAARDIIDAYTPYARDVDDPETDTRADVLMLSTSGSDIAEDLASPPAATDPWEVTQLDGANQFQTGWFYEVEDEDFDGGQYFADTRGNPGAWSGGATVRFDGAGDGVRVTFFADHEIPQGECVLELLRATPDGNPPFDILFDGDVVDSSPADALTGGSDEFDLQWGVSWTLNQDGPVEPGFHSVELSCTGSGSGDYWADALHVRDNRFDYTFDATPVDGVVDGPEEFATTVDVVLDDVASVEQVVAGDLEVDMSSTAGDQAVAISNDQGNTWIEADNTETVAGEFASATNQIRAWVTLSPYSADPDTSPALGDAGQSVDDIALRANLEDTPVVFDKAYRDRVGNVLADIATDGRMVWELRRDPDAPADDPEGYIVEWTQIGQRERESTQPVTRVERRTTLETSYDRVVVFGRSVRRESVEWSVSETDTLTGLGDSWIVPGSERVYDPDTGDVFDRGDDYRMQWDIGGIAVLDGGQMQTETTYRADYDTKYRGEATTAGVDAADARTVERTIPGATSDRECDQLALSVLKDVQEAQVEAEVTLLESRPEIPLVEALSHPRLPEGPHEIRGVEEGAAGQERTYRLANRRSVDEFVDALQEDIGALSDVV